MLPLRAYTSYQKSKTELDLASRTRYNSVWTTQPNASPHPWQLQRHSPQTAHPFGDFATCLLYAPTLNTPRTMYSEHFSNNLLPPPPQEIRSGSARRHTLLSSAPGTTKPTTPRTRTGQHKYLSTANICLYRKALVPPGKPTAPSTLALLLLLQYVYTCRCSLG